MSVRAKAVIACSFLLMSAAALVLGQGAPTAPPPAFPPQTISLPTFTSNATVAGTNYTYTLLGNDPAKGGTTTIPTVLAAIKLTIEAPMDAAGRKAVLDAGPVANQVIASPIFADYQFASGTTQYADAIMRADFHAAGRQRRLAYAARTTEGAHGEHRCACGSRLRPDVEEDGPDARDGRPAVHAAGAVQAIAEGCCRGRHAARGRGTRYDLLRQCRCDTVLPLGHVWRGHVGRRTAAVRAGHLSGPERGGRGRRRPADCPAAGAILPGSAARPAVPRCSRGARPGQRLSGVDEGARPDHAGATAPEQRGRRQRHRERRERSDRHELEECGAGVDAVRG